MKNNLEVEGGGSVYGCVGLILTTALIWALLFGITWKGVHYYVDCSSEKGVHFTQEKVSNE